MVRENRALQTSSSAHNGRHECRPDGSACYEEHAERNWEWTKTRAGDDSRSKGPALQPAPVQCYSVAREKGARLSCGKRGTLAQRNKPYDQFPIDWGVSRGRVPTQGLHLAFDCTEMPVAGRVRRCRRRTPGRRWSWSRPAGGLRSRRSEGRFRRWWRRPGR
mgnify:CR=1 FL=1